MTVQELIDKLQTVQDKGVSVYCPMAILHSLEITEVKVLTAKHSLDGVQTDDVEIGVAIS